MPNKKITHAARALILIFETGLFAAVFFFYYADRTLKSPNKIGGTIIYVLFWYLIYRYICASYNAFRIMSKKRWDLVLTQTIAFGIADLILYAAICSGAHAFVNLIPGILTVCAQIFVAYIGFSIAQKALERYSQPKKALFIIGRETNKDDLKRCINELKHEHDDIVYVKRVMDEQDALRNLDDIIEAYDSVVMFEISPDARNEIVKACYVHSVEFYFTPSLPDIILRGSSPRHITETPLYKYDFVYEKTSYQKLKRFLDIVFAVLILIPALPIMAITAVCIRTDGGPALFVQKRYGKNKKIFSIYKFRSMVVDADSYGVIPTGENDPRITKVGAFIRRTRIDELPQLFNILLGDMSFVGPRPERVEHIDEYSKELPEFLYRLKVPQGLTGYAQVFGKYNTTPYDKVRLDMQYIENQSLLTDLRLILLTISTVFKKESTEGFSNKEISQIYQNCKNEQGRAANPNEKSKEITAVLEREIE